MKKLYIGCALSNIPLSEKEKFLAMIEHIKKSLRRHFEVLEFLGTGKGSPEEVYNRDILEGIGSADCMLAIFDHSSSGLGFETAIAVKVRGIPVLATAHRDSYVSRLIEGIPSSYFHMIRYDSPDDIADITLEVMSAHGLVDLKV